MHIAQPSASRVGLQLTVAGHYDGKMNWRGIGACCAMSAMIFLTSCGGTATFNGCTQSIGIDPNPATADHSASLPGNQVTFTATLLSEGSNCPLVATVIGDVDASWTTSDPVNTTITNQKTNVGTNGLATCVNATANPTIITASTTGGLRSTAPLTCK
jgi:hypothetical protein